MNTEPQSQPYVFLYNGMLDNFKILKKKFLNTYLKKYIFKIEIRSELLNFIKKKIIFLR